MPFDLPPFLLETTAGFFLVFIRYSGLMTSAPLLSTSSFPMPLRVWFSFWLAIVSYPIVGVPSGGEYLEIFATWESLLFAVFSEFALGWILGLVCSFLIWATQLAGHFISQEIGFAIGEVFDPISQSVASPLATLFMTVATLVFVVLDGPYLIFAAIHKSIAMVPPGTFSHLNAEVSLAVVRDFGGDIWSTALQMALPIMFGLFLATVAMAILARTVPEMNIFILGFAIRIGLGVVALAVCIPFLLEFMREVQWGLHERVGHILELMTGVVDVR